MKKLLNKTKNSVISSQVEFAETFLSRTVGLIGKKNWTTDNALWIKSCSSIHTCFMSFAIDALFVDKNLIVRKKVLNLKPWRITVPTWSANSVFELPAGTIQKSKTEVGDQLDVVD